MKKVVSVVALSLASASVTYAQAVLVNGIVAGLTLGRRAAQGEFADKTVHAVTYRGASFPLKRTPADQLSGKSADQIAFLEAQLTTCYSALLADSVGSVCTPAQLTTLQATQAIIARARPLWSQKYYREEMAFYVAEEARRQALRAQ